jgi:hypothetical protein
VGRELSKNVCTWIQARESGLGKGSSLNDSGFFNKDLILEGYHPGFANTANQMVDFFRSHGN